MKGIAGDLEAAGTRGKLTVTSEFSLGFSSSGQKAGLSQVLSDWVEDFSDFSRHFFFSEHPPLFFVSSLDCSEKD